ncbi:hypothetical protein VVR26_09585 [Corynebacterium camporealensis]|uniref:hypothetical protein n=1 Tax=Corynebacterium camporealensis TaxID=161896 RepID=UPI0034CEE98C
MTPEQLVEFTGITRPHVREQATVALKSAESFVAAYTRGRHKRGGEFREGVEDVIITVAARILSNPEQVSVREQVGPYSMYRGEGFKGFTLVELAVLNRYRKQAI